MPFYKSSFSPYNLLILIILFKASTALASENIKEDSTTRSFTNEPIQPVPLIVQGDPRVIDLGRKLFMDTRLSANNTISCASCHPLKNAGSDEQSDVFFKELWRAISKAKTWYGEIKNRAKDSLQTKLEIRKDSRLEHLPIIAITAHVMSEQRQLYFLHQMNEAALRLAPLLKKYDLESIQVARQLAEILQYTTESETLIKQLKTYDFSGAQQSLTQVMEFLNLIKGLQDHG